MTLDYDIIVIGGGHAGCEAASAAARLGSRTLLLTMDMAKLAAMSCNPAVGGVAKGQIVREIDALGGQMGRITDLTTIQFRMLNRSKGAAMWSPRAQCDKTRFSEEWRRTLENTWMYRYLAVICCRCPPEKSSALFWDLWCLRLGMADLLFMSYVFPTVSGWPVRNVNRRFPRCRTSREIRR